MKRVSGDPLFSLVYIGGLHKVWVTTQAIHYISFANNVTYQFCGLGFQNVVRYSMKPCYMAY